MNEEYLAVYIESDMDDLSNMGSSLRDELKSHLSMATAKKHYDVKGTGYSGGVAVVKADLSGVDLDELAGKLNSDTVIYATGSTARDADQLLSQKRD